MDASQLVIIAKDTYQQNDACGQLPCDGSDEQDIICTLCYERHGGLEAWQQADDEALGLLMRHREERPKCQMEKFCPTCIVTYVHTWEEDPRREHERSGCARNGYCCPLCRFELRKPSLESEITRASKRFQLDVSQFQQKILSLDGAHREDKRSARRILQALVQTTERRTLLIKAAAAKEQTSHRQDRSSFGQSLQLAINQLNSDMHVMNVMIKLAP